MQFVRPSAEKAMDDSRIVEHSVPWTRESPMTRELLVDGDANGKCRFHKLDTWHCLHLGAGKAWVAGAIVLLQEALGWESSYDLRIAELSRAYRKFCIEHRITPFITGFDKNTFGGGGSNEPNGCWSKAALTSNFMLFIEHLCIAHRDVVMADERLRCIVAGPKGSPKPRRTVVYVVLRLSAPRGATPSCGVSIEKTFGFLRSELRS